MISLVFADACMSAWGAYLRAEVDDEVGLPSVSPSCSEYDAPDWESPPAPAIAPEDLVRTLTVMGQIRVIYPRLHRDLREHYRDGRRLGYQRVEEGKAVFVQQWGSAAEPNACIFAQSL